MKLTSANYFKGFIVTINDSFLQLQQRNVCGTSGPKPRVNFSVVMHNQKYNGMERERERERE